MRSVETLLRIRVIFTYMVGLKVGTVKVTFLGLNTSTSGGDIYVCYLWKKTKLWYLWKFCGIKRFAAKVYKGGPIILKRSQNENLH